MFTVTSLKWHWGLFTGISLKWNYWVFTGTSLKWHLWLFLVLLWGSTKGCLLVLIFSDIMGYSLVLLKGSTIRDILYLLGIILRNIIGVSTLPSEVALIDVYCFLGKVSKKKTIESLTAVKPTPDPPPPPIYDHLRFFFFNVSFFYWWSCLVWYETDFVKFWAHFDHGNHWNTNYQSDKFGQIWGERWDLQGQITWKR